MTLLSNTSLTRVKLKAGVLGTVLAESVKGRIYTLGSNPDGETNGKKPDDHLVTLPFVNFPDIGPPLTGDNFNKDQVGLDATGIAVEPAADRDVFLWVYSPTHLRRFPMREDGTNGLPDRVIPVSQLNLEGPPTEYRIDQGILYARSGRKVNAFRLAGILEGQPKSPIERGGFLLPEDVTRWDVKTVQGRRVVAYIAPDTVQDKPYAATIHYGPDESFAVQNNEAAFYGRLGTDDYWKPGHVAIGSFGGEAILVVGNEKLDEIAYLQEGKVIQQSAGFDNTTNDIGKDYDGTAYYDTFDMALVQQGRPEGDAVQGGLIEQDALARATGQAVEESTIAAQQQDKTLEFTTLRERTIEVELLQVDPDFLVNRNWYFVHGGWSYTMVSLSTEQEREGGELTVTAQFALDTYAEPKYNEGVGGGV